MKSLTQLALAALIACSALATQAGPVSGYFRSNGTYMAPYYRSDAGSLGSSPRSSHADRNPYAAYLAFPLAADSTNVVVERVDLGEAAPIKEAVELVCKRMSAGQFASKDVSPALQGSSQLVCPDCQGEFMLPEPVPEPEPQRILPPPEFSQTPGSQWSVPAPNPFCLDYARRRAETGRAIDVRLLALAHRSVRSDPKGILRRKLPACD